MWVEFVVGSRSCSVDFSPGTPVFLPSQKPTFRNSSGDLETLDEEPLCVCATEIPIYFFHLVIGRLFQLSLAFHLVQ